MFVKFNILYNYTYSNFKLYISAVVTRQYTFGWYVVIELISKGTLLKNSLCLRFLFTYNPMNLKVTQKPE